MTLKLTCRMFLGACKRLRAPLTSIWGAAVAAWSSDPDSSKHRSLVGECTASRGEVYSQPAPTYAPYASAGFWPVTLLIWLDKYFMREVDTDVVVVAQQDARLRSAGP